MYRSTISDEQNQDDSINEEKIQLRSRALSETSTLPKGMYPTTDKLLCRLLDDDAEFPIRSRTTLWRWMKKLGFEYKRTSTISNSIGLRWAGIKASTRDNNTSFRLSDVQRLASKWIAAVDASTAQSYFAHAYQHELVFKQADAIAEEVDDDEEEEEEDEAQITADETEDEIDA
ncbi:unnamed protein product [Rotaria sp. Silwood1]|nr:unnamed protein product [Rotaria sp. Silwood1]